MAINKEEKVLLEQLHKTAIKDSKVLSNYIDDYQDISATMARLGGTKQLLINPNMGSRIKLNRFLDDTNLRLGAEIMFVLNAKGDVIGSSNYLSQHNLLGKNYTFRPYYQQAILGEPATYYATGSVTGLRGYYFANPILSKGKVLGVIVIKLSLNSVFKTLNDGPFDYLLVGNNSVIFAASNALWNNRTLYQIPKKRQEAIIKTKRYKTTSLLAVGTNSIKTVFDTNRLRLIDGIAENSYYSRRVSILEPRWHFFSTVSRTILFIPVMQYVLIYSLIYLLFLFLWLYLRKHAEVKSNIEEQNTTLETRVNALTYDLTKSNHELKDLVEHYKSMQKELKDTQIQLIQSAKLAVLGKLSASINHELNQPILALQTYTENGQRLLEIGRYQTVKENLSEILKIASSMHKMVARFKIFARKSSPEKRVCFISEIIDACLVVMTPLLNESRLKFTIYNNVENEKLLCEPVQISQVLVNLITNAVDAVELQKERVVTLTIVEHQDYIVFAVNDNGPGIAKEMIEQIFEPFYSTKASGSGLGLAISRKIVETQLGTLIVDGSVSAGTSFVMSLPKFKER
jgi:two-component system C4-dicarboxylate transport sensor histidine kinase DctB